MNSHSQRDHGQRATSTPSLKSTAAQARTRLHGDHSESEKSYWNALRDCRRLAMREHRSATEALIDAEADMAVLSDNLKRAGQQCRGGSQAGDETQERIQSLKRTLDREARKKLRTARDALEQKTQRLSQFTVTLFGRTIAGKSTIREAITGGDGRTIGKGAQRTTRDVREYDWNELRIVDTPGIGAYEGQADQALALSAATESDLLLFMLSSDSVQESTFRGMQAVSDQNKPLLFVLNVKRDLERGVNKRRLLRDPERFLAGAAVRGHINRIRQLACDELGMRKVEVLVIHAQAAFLATREPDTRVARQLHEASGMERLLAALTDEVRQRGPIRRTQTLLDGTSGHLTDLEEFLHTQAQYLDGSGLYLKEKFSELDVWLDGYIGSTDQRIEDQANRFFRPLRESVSSFVDDNLECADVNARWARRVQSLDIQTWSNNLCQQLHDEVRAQLAEFNREIEVESELTGALHIGGPGQVDPWDVRRTLRWASALSGALAGISLLVGSTNFWNPVGWVAGGAGFVFMALSWRLEDRQSKLQRHKAGAAQQLREQIDDMERRVADRVKGWFHKNITTRLVGGIRQDAHNLCNDMFAIARDLRQTKMAIHSSVEQLNRRLLVRTGALVHADTVRGQDIARLVRYPGHKTKFLWAGETPFPGFCKSVGIALGEWVEGIVPTGTAEMVAAALAPARVDPAWVAFRDDGAAVARLPASEVRRAIGRHGHNVALASKLLKLRIDIQEQEKSDS